MKGRIIAFVIAIAGAGMFLVMSYDARVMLGRPDILGGPARVTDAHGDRVYFPTSLWERKVWDSGSKASFSRRTVAYCTLTCGH